ncbi:ML domain-containing protein [Xylariaceae sp. FL0804]|nr:ML domain-containing protein [Xylariaceae sp. FL0804]
MRISTAACVVLSSAAGLASAAAGGGWFGGKDASASGAEKVPGDSPLELCDTDHSNDIVHIESVDLLPNPPSPGSEMVIRATGTVFETVEKDAYVNLVVKYGLIRLVNTKVDLCEQVENVDLSCPIEKGVLSITKAVDIPKEVPPGTYNVYAEVVNANKKPITCLQASVTFGGKKKSIGDL